ncbi:MAG: hypothetical protein LPH21_17645, partial [Shewanella sp.]|nr:hypothetical protein [Shewanella sp.]
SRHSSLIKGKVNVFQGRAEFLTLEEAKELGLPIREHDFIDTSEGMWNDKLLQLTELSTNRTSGRVREVKKVEDAKGRVREVEEVRVRRRTRIRR